MTLTAILVGVTGISAGPPDGVGPPPVVPGLAKASQVANGHAKGLLDILGVAGVGAGLTEAGKPAVVVLLESGSVNVPTTVGGFPVVTVVTGRIYSLAPPAAQASFTSSCSGLNCTFDGSGSSGRRLSYAWAFGDGATDSGQTVTHTYGADDTYRVTLTVTDKAGNQDSTFQDVTVSGDGGPPPPRHHPAAIRTAM